VTSHYEVDSKTEFVLRVRGYLRDRLAAEDLRLQRAEPIVGGASREMWSVTACWTEARGRPTERKLILRLDPPSSLLESGRHTEFALYRALSSVAGVPVPAVLFNEDDPSILGMPFFVMQHVNGVTQPSELFTDEFAGRRQHLVREVFRTLGRIAALDWNDLSLADHIREPGGHPASIELDRWERVLDDHDLGPFPITRSTIRQLRRELPPHPPRLSVIHGDYRVGNVLITPEGISAVLDWELAHLGDPLEDLAWAIAPNWRLSQSPELIAGTLEEAAAIEAWQAASELRVDGAALRWWQLFSHVKAMGIWTAGAAEFVRGCSDNLVYGLFGWRNFGREESWMMQRRGLGAL